MFRTIVVPLDGSTCAEQSLPIALELARRAPARLMLVRVHQPPVMAMTRSYEWDAEVRRREEQYLTETAARLSDSLGAAPDVALLDGHAADAISRTAQDCESPLIVMTSHGLTGFSRFWIGSVTDAVIRQARTPVLMVRSRDTNEAPPPSEVREILVPLDGSAAAEAILPHALCVAEATGAKVELFRVVTPAHVQDLSPTLQEDVNTALIRQGEDDLRAVAARLGNGAARCRVDVKVSVGDAPASSIREYARTHGCELVAMTTAASGLARVIGSVADKVIRHGPPMALLIRPAETGT